MIELWDFGEPWNRVRDALIWLGSGGSGWPQANEDQIRELSRAWQSVGERLQAGLSDANSAAADLLAAWGGDGGSAFAEQWQSLGVTVPQELVDIILNGVDGQPGLAASLEQAALDIEYDKISTLVETTVVIIEIFVILVAAVLAFWAAWAAAGMRIAMGRAAIWAFMRGLITAAARSFGQRGLRQGLLAELKHWGKNVLKFEIAKEIGAETGVDITAQLIQYGKGTRTDWDGKKTAASAVGGAAGALLSFATPIGDKIAGNITNRAGKGLVDLGTRATDEFITEIGAETVANGAVYGNWQLNLGNLGNRIGSGMVRDGISGKADLGGRAADLGRQVLGLDTRADAASNAATAAAN
ncbi:MAG: WXG100 family type VII secretion target, partial [Hamadaea sp.]|nr:WXG100 family type VII secretion target [Hamadaea sp.]